MESRKIKFRIWNLEKKEWSERERFIGEQYANLSDDYPFIYQQFTGLLDRNGKEIYEGDICRTFNSKMIGLIEYNEKFESYAQFIGFKFKCYQIDGNLFLSSSSNSIYQPFGRASNFYEIIGNIFENPELLKQ